MARPWWLRAIPSWPPTWRAAPHCVSSDGAAVHGARVVAAMEAAAVVEPDLERLLDTALTFIPADSTIARLTGDVREWHAAAGAARPGRRAPRNP